MTLRNNYSKNEALTALKRYCAYQDRCAQEVRNKLLSLGIQEMEMDDIVEQLIEEKFLDEERYARSFARGKFRMKQWGRRRIVQELQKRNISEHCIRVALSEIEELDYRDALRTILQKHFLTASGNPLERIKKAVDAALRRGFEPEMVHAESIEIFKVKDRP